MFMMYVKDMADKVQCATNLDDHEASVIRGLADRRKWSISQTIAELVRESPTFLAELAKQHPQPASAEA